MLVRCVSRSSWIWILISDVGQTENPVRQTISRSPINYWMPNRVESSLGSCDILSPQHAPFIGKWTAMTKGRTRTEKGEVKGGVVVDQKRWAWLQRRRHPIGLVRLSDRKDTTKESLGQKKDLISFGFGMTLESKLKWNDTEKSSLIFNVWFWCDVPTIQERDCRWLQKSAPLVVANERNLLHYHYGRLSTSFWRRDTKKTCLVGSSRREEYVLAMPGSLDTDGGGEQSQ